MLHYIKSQQLRVAARYPNIREKRVFTIRAVARSLYAHNERTIAMLTYRFRDFAALGIPHGRVQIGNLMKRGSFPQATRLLNNTLVWTRDSVDQWLEARKAA